MAKFIEVIALNNDRVTVNVELIVSILPRNEQITTINTVNSVAAIAVNDTYENVVQAVIEASK